MRRIFLSYFMAVIFLISTAYIGEKIRNNTDVTEINVLHNGNVIKMPQEQYITRVVCAEMPESFEVEALKAQAVAARTYLYYKMSKEKKHENADICTDYKCCQAYTEAKNSDKINRAVYDTAGEIITYEGKPILSVFHSAAGGGRTERSGDVWASSLPYLSSVETKGEQEKDNFLTTVTYNISDFKSTVKNSFPNANEAVDLIGEITCTPGGAVDVIEIMGVKIKGTKIRSMFGLKSACFTLELSGENIIFNVKGSGHGVGMSQYGANYMAKEGKKYDEILNYYYTGTKIMQNE